MAMMKEEVFVILIKRGWNWKSHNTLADALKGTWTNLNREGSFTLEEVCKIENIQLSGDL